MSRIFIALITVILIAIPGTLSADDSHCPIELAISVPQGPITNASNLQLTATLTNKSAQSIDITQVVDDIEVIYRFEVRREDHRGELERTDTDNVDLFTTYTTSLAPAAFLQETINIGQLYNFKPGRYVIRAERFIGGQHQPADIESKEIKVEIGNSND